MDENVFLTSERIDFLKGHIEQGTPPAVDAFARLQKQVDERMGDSPRVTEEWLVPAYASGPEKYLAATAPLAEDGLTAYGCALLFRLYGNAQHLERATAILRAWADGFQSCSRRGDSKTAFCICILPMIIAADLLRNGGAFDVGRERSKGDVASIFERFLVAKVMPIGETHRRDYHACWAMTLRAIGAAYLRDGVAFEHAVRRWQTLLNGMLAADGSLKHVVNSEGGRLGLLYTNRCLTALCLSAHTATLNGSNLFYHKTESGRTLRDAVSVAAAWSADPDSFPYWNKSSERLIGREEVPYLELIPSSWYDGTIVGLLRELRPISDEGTMPFVTLTHGKEL